MVLEASTPSSWKTQLRDALKCKCIGKCPKPECKRPDCGENPPWVAVWNWWKSRDKKFKQLFWLGVCVLLLLLLMLPLLLPLVMPSSPATTAPAPHPVSNSSFSWPHWSLPSSSPPTPRCPDGAGECAACPACPAAIVPTSASCPSCPQCDGSPVAPHAHHRQHDGAAEPCRDAAGGGLVGSIMGLCTTLLALLGAAILAASVVPRFCGAHAAAAALDCLLGLVAIGSGSEVMRALRSEQARWRAVLGEGGQPLDGGEGGGAEKQGEAGETKDDADKKGDGEKKGDGGEKKEKEVKVAGEKKGMTLRDLASGGGGGGGAAASSDEDLEAQLARIKEQLASVKEKTFGVAPDKWDEELGVSVAEGLFKAEADLASARHAAKKAPSQDEVAKAAGGAAGPSTPPSGLAAAFAAKRTPTSDSKTRAAEPKPPQAPSTPQTPSEADATAPKDMAAFFAKGAKKKVSANL